MRVLVAPIYQKKRKEIKEMSAKEYRQWSEDRRRIDRLEDHHLNNCWPEIIGWKDEVIISDLKLPRDANYEMCVSTAFVWYDCEKYDAYEYCMEGPELYFIM